MRDYFMKDIMKQTKTSKGGNIMAKVSINQKKGVGVRVRKTLAILTAFVLFGLMLRVSLKT
jgi:hypothetical protein